MRHVAFLGARKLAEGELAEVLPILKSRFDADRGEVVLVFDLESGRQVDFDLRGSVDDVLARAGVAAARGPGRPKLGVVGREVSLLPRHWDWLEAQAGGASGAIRSLVDAAVTKEPAGARAKRRRAAVGRWLGAIAGDRPHFEDATRALYAGDDAKFTALIEKWPKDIRELALFEIARA